MSILWRGGFFELIGSVSDAIVDGSASASGRMGKTVFVDASHSGRKKKAAKRCPRVDRPLCGLSTPSHTTGEGPNNE